MLLWALLLALLAVIYGRTLSPELLANFEHQLVDEYRDGIADGSIANVDEFLGADKLLQKVKNFANSFRSNPDHARRVKRETSSYYGALLDSSK